jgi:hypothetical protein
MSAETLTDVAVVDRLDFSSGAFRAFVNRLLPGRRRDTGDALRAVDLAERPTTNTSAPDDHQSVVAPLTARIETLEAELAKLRSHRRRSPGRLRARTRAVRTADGGST